MVSFQQNVILKLVTFFSFNGEFMQAIRIAARFIYK